MKKIIAPSLLAADFLNLEKDIKKLENTSAQWIHLDIMDGHFVPNLTFGFDLIGRVNQMTNMVLDAHLMTSNPGLYLEEFVKAGVCYFTFHYEALEKEEIKNLINNIHKLGCKAGIALKPKTNISAIDDFLPLVDMVLVMSVEPGFGGQAFMEESVERVGYFNEMRLKYKYNYLIQVDGGINNETGQKVKMVGCDVLVAGSYLFCDKMEERIIDLGN